MSLLEVEDVGIRFGGVVALDGLTFSVGAGEICALIGPNGAGKTTLFNVISRLYEPTQGRVRFGGTDLLALPAHRIAEEGISRTFQNLALVAGLSVIDNVLVGAHARTRGGFLSTAAALPMRSQERQVRAEAMEILERLGLAPLANLPCFGLPYGTMKRVELARALLARPRLLMLDEPATGLTHSEVGSLAELIRELRDGFDLTVLLVEHHMGMVMSISEHVVVLDLGRKIADGAPTAVQNDERVIAAYLGGGE